MILVCAANVEALSKKKDPLDTQPLVQSVGETFVPVAIVVFLVIEIIKLVVKNIEEYFGETVRIIPV